MTPYYFGYKIAAQNAPAPAAPSTPFGKSAPNLNPAGYDIKTDQQAQMWRDHGLWAGANKYTKEPPKPFVPHTPKPPNPENQRILTNYRKMYPQFPDGAHRDMLQLTVQNNGSNLAAFLRNSLKRYPQQTSPAPAR